MGIDIKAPVIEFLNQVASCDFIFSSSLHGLIAADSLGIPNKWVKFSDLVLGNGYKFKDYYSVFGLEDEKPLCDFTIIDKKYVESIALNYRRDNLLKIQENLINAFPLK